MIDLTIVDSWKRSWLPMQCLTIHRAPVFSIVGLVVRITTIESPDLTYDQPEIILWGAAEITTGLICVCISPLAALAQPRHNRARRTYYNFHSAYGSRPNNASGRTRPGIFEAERDVFTSSDVELQHSGATPGVVAFSPTVPLVTTDISTGDGAHGRFAEKREFEVVGLEVREEKKAGDASRGIGVTTTIRSEQYYL